MKKNVLFILGSLNRGGAERVISVISRQLAEEGYGVTILLLLQYKVDYEMHKDIRIIDLSGNDKSRLLHTFFWIKNIRKHVKESNPDSIVAFFARINILTILACLGLKKKLIISERNDPQHDGRGFMVNVATRVLYPLADKVVFQTKRVSSYFPYLSNATIIFNPISVSSVSKNTNLKKIVTVGRLTVQKNQKLLIESFSEVLKKYPNDIKIYAVSIDIGHNTWRNAIEKDQTQEFIHVIGTDQDRRNVRSVEVLGIERIPRNFLLDRNCRIIAKDLHDEQLMQTLDSLTKQ